MRATATEAHVPRAHAPQTREATTMRSLHTTTKTRPHSLQLEKSLYTTKTQHSQKLKKKKKKKLSPNYDVIDKQVRVHALLTVRKEYHSHRGKAVHLKLNQGTGDLENNTTCNFLSKMEVAYKF